MKFLYLISVCMFLIGCCHAIPTLPDNQYETFSPVETEDNAETLCLKQTFSVTNEYIGFEDDTVEVPNRECVDITGFTLEIWNKLEKDLKEIYDIHDIPEEKRIKIDLSRDNLKNDRK